MRREACALKGNHLELSKYQLQLNFSQFIKDKFIFDKIFLEFVLKSWFVALFLVWQVGMIIFLENRHDIVTSDGVRTIYMYSHRACLTLGVKCKKSYC
jgi:hypothetical protein